MSAGSLPSAKESVFLHWASQTPKEIEDIKEGCPRDVIDER